ncbi:MAG: TonB-dependent receptor plug domain-containing protein [Opitutaceae bacterium]|nr:TonB-dependent receptor plug domain-containing protein [Opitutaceae bacterium]
MTPIHLVASVCGRRFAIVLLAVAAPLAGQTIPAGSDAAVLAKYDRNKNGVLDAEELAQMQRDDARSGGAITLTPFEVSTDKDVGYAAGNTLSGGRVDTPLALTPGSISVMTKEFMDDFNITNMNDAGSWTMGFDLGTSVPNSDPSSISVYQNIVRGAPSTDNFPTRNGAINFGAADSYNTERFEFQRGPDTSMFGDGGPGGRQGSSSKRARFGATATSFSLQGDTYGGHRATLDFSKGWKNFGLRLNALNQNAPGYQDHTPKRKNAATLNAVVRVAKNTTVIAEFERVSEWNNLWSVTNGDAQNLWDGVTVNSDNSALLANNNTTLNNAGLERMTVGANGSAANMFVYNFATGDMQDYGGNQYRTRGINGAATRIPYVGNKYLIAVPARRAAIPGIDPHFAAAPRDNIADRDASTLFLNVEHRVGDLFVRVGFTKNDFDNNTIWSNLSPNAAIIDVNRLLPNGQPNPRYLRTFTDVEQNNIYSQDAIREFYGLATYRFFKPKWWDYKQQISLSLSDRETESENRTSAWRRTDNPVQTDPFNNANRFFYRVYWGDARPYLGPVLQDPNGKVPGRWAYADTAGNITERGVKRAGLTSQSAFFNEKLAITLSFSRDAVEVANRPRLAAGLPGSTGAAGGFKNLLGFGTAGTPFRREETAQSVAYGAVVYPFQSERFGRLRGVLAPLGFVFNYAENTQPPSSGVQNPLLDGSLPPLTHSDTRDFGFRYSVPGGKAYLTVTHYETTQRDNPAAFGSAGDIANIWTNLGYTDPKLTTTTAGVGFAYSDPNSRRLEGWEVELTANPTRSVTLTVNYSHPVSYIITESEDRKAYVAQHRAEWDRGAAAAQGQVIGGRAILDPTTIQNALRNIDNSLAGLTTGTLENNQVRHRINLAGSYRFREGLLRGLGLNAGVQYRGHGKNGSRDPRIKFNLPETTTPTVLQNTQAAFDYLWTPPAWLHTITLGANYTRRIGKYQTRFQLNVTNLLDNRDPIWGRSGPVGNFASAYTTLTPNQLFANNPRMQILTSFVNPDPRKFIFSTTVSF